MWISIPVVNKRTTQLLLCVTALLWALCAVAQPKTAQPATDIGKPKRVLILHSFGRDFAPFNAIAPALRSRLSELWREPLSFFETSLDVERPMRQGVEAAFVAFLRARYQDAPPHLVVTIGAPAMHLYLSNRDRLFNDVPLLATGADARRIPEGVFRAKDASVALKLDLSSIPENILQLLPETRSIVVVLGNSPLDHFWLKQLQNDFEPFRNRVDFVWFNDLPLHSTRKKLAGLPKNSAVFYGMLSVDGAGVPHEHERALDSLREAVNVPMFGIFESQLGKGIVGGRLMSMTNVGALAGETGYRMLSGKPLANEQLKVVPLSSPAYDSRELDRFRIPDSRLPEGSSIRFIQPTIWDEHRALIVATVTVLLLQGLLISALLLQRNRRRRAEFDARELSGRLLTAHEEERSRLARDLHDDFTQRLARLAMDAAVLERPRDSMSAEITARELREELVRMSEDVHTLAYRLHPAVLDDLGLVEALKAECDRLCRQEIVLAKFECDVTVQSIPPDAALCLFRIAQEALRNVVRHSGSPTADVKLTQRNQGLELQVNDKGRGFDLTRRQMRTSLGLASMRERIRLAGGTLDIDSASGQGTRVRTWVPLKGTPP